MRLSSEATLLKMETSCTRLRKEIEDAPTFWQTWQYPTLSLKPNQTYSRKSYLWASFLSASAATLFICLTQCLVLAVVLVIVVFVYPQLWPVIFNPRNHAHQIGLLSQKGFYYLPFVPLIWLMASLAVNWPRYFFWNRRAKRLQREGPVQVPIIAAAVVLEDKTIWPPAPTGKV